MVRAMCLVQFKDGRNIKSFAQLLGLSETMNQLAMAYTPHWYIHVLIGPDGHQTEDESHGTKGRPKKM